MIYDSRPTTGLAEPLTAAQVLDDITGMLREMLAEYLMDDLPITRQTSFHDDLELESVDLVELAGRLQARFGDLVNLAEFLADKDLAEVVALRVGELVDYVTSRLAGSTVAEG